MIISKACCKVLFKYIILLTHNYEQQVYALYAQFARKGTNTGIYKKQTVYNTHGGGENLVSVLSGKTRFEFSVYYVLVGT